MLYLVLAYFVYFVVCVIFKIFTGSVLDCPWSKQFRHCAKKYRHIFGLSMKWESMLQLVASGVHHPQTNYFQ